MVMCTPALAALLAHYPDAEFTFLTSPEGKRILGNFNPRIDRYLIYDRRYAPSIFYHRRLNKEIIDAGFQAIYCFEKNQRYYRLFKGSTAAVYGLGQEDKGKHYAQLLLDVVSRGAGKNVGFYPLYLPVDEQALQANQALMETVGIAKNSLLIALHPTFSGIHKWRKVRKHGRNKIWPHSRSAQLADCLHRYARQRNWDLHVVMNMLPEDKNIGDAIAEKSREGIDIMIPKPNFRRYAAFLQRVDLFVSPDTGPMHFAAALGTPLVALFAGKDPNDCGPFGQRKKFRVIRAEDMQTNISGLSAISVESVFQVCKEQLDLIADSRNIKSQQS